LFCPLPCYFNNRSNYVKNALHSFFLAKTAIREPTSGCNNVCITFECDFVGRCSPSRASAFADSATVFRYGVQKYPGSAQLRVGLGVALFNLGQYDDAVETLCEAVDLNPADPGPFVFLGRVGDASPRLTDEVLRRLVSFVRLYPRNASSNYYYALALWQNQGGQRNKTDIDQVEALLKTAIALDPHLYETHFQLGVLYQEQERYSDAIVEYTEAAKLRPDFGKAHYRLARMYRIAGKKTLAQKELAISRRLREQEEAAERSSPARAEKQ
jgi:tetratricopeptide (TPR) repeat protein